MTNKEIAASFDLLARVMELHNENPFKIKSYQNAYLTLRKLDQPLSSYSVEQLMEIKGVGEAIAEKIQSLAQTGSMPTLDKYLAKTPPGVVEMLKINGLGPKKVAILWKEHQMSSPGELLYACNENRLVEWKGFGAKTQDAIIQAIGFLQSNEGKYLHSTVNHHAQEIIKLILDLDRNSKTEVTGHLRRGFPIVEKLELITTASAKDILTLEREDTMEWNHHDPNLIKGVWKDFLPVEISLSPINDFYKNLFQSTGPAHFISSYSPGQEDYKVDNDLFNLSERPFISPELRDIKGIDQWTDANLRNLITEDHIKGIIHAHSSYSDGIHSLKEMGAITQRLGFQYLVITDHSRAAAYAKGMSDEKVQAQWKEIDELNRSYKNFRIIKGIECDILSNGDLDYDDSLLSGFEVVIASIHSAFNMDIDKATWRVIKAIENPHTNILGHPSGRLILTREGYPLNYSKIIDACAANQVANELNANPQRLDIDQKFIHECMDKGVLISINPDAHNQSAIRDIKYGVLQARRGMLKSVFCLNTKSTEELLDFCK
jgi:DNA polymerase (family 10)